MTREQILERRCTNFKNVMKTLVGDRFEVNATVWNIQGLITTNDYLYLMDSEEIPEKPPLGLMPRHMWNKKRRDELSEAMLRYMEVGKSIPQEWIDEYNELCGKG